MKVQSMTGSGARDREGHYIFRDERVKEPKGQGFGWVLHTDTTQCIKKRVGKSMNKIE